MWHVLKCSGDKSEKFDWQATRTYSQSFIWPVLFSSIPQPPPVPIPPTDKSRCDPERKENRLKQQRTKITTQDNFQYSSNFNNLRIIILDHVSARKSWTSSLHSKTSNVPNPTIICTYRIEISLHRQGGASTNKRTHICRPLFQYLTVNR